MPIKIAVWTYSLAVCVALYSMVDLGILFRVYFGELLGNKPLPLLTDFFIQMRWGCLLGALPVLVCARRLTIDPKLAADRVLAFAGTCTLFIVFLFGLAITAFLQPFFRITFRLGQQ
jgi:hypothetical protein